MDSQCAHAHSLKIQVDLAWLQSLAPLFGTCMGIRDSPGSYLHSGGFLPDCNVPGRNPANYQQNVPFPMPKMSEMETLQAERSVF